MAASPLDFPKQTLKLRTIKIRSTDIRKEGYHIAHNIHTLGPEIQDMHSTRAPTPKSILLLTKRVRCYHIRDASNLPPTSKKKSWKQKTDIHRMQAQESFILFYLYR